MHFYQQRNIDVSAMGNRVRVGRRFGKKTAASHESGAVWVRATPKSAMTTRAFRRHKAAHLWQRLSENHVNRQADSSILLATIIERRHHHV